MMITTRRKIVFAIFLVFLIVAITSGTLFRDRLARFTAIFALHPGFSLSQPDIQKVHAVGTETREEVVPRIIHQIFHNWTDTADTTIPSDWEETRQTIIDLNPDYVHKLWLASDSRQFIEDEYPWFLETYDGLPYPVQKTHVLRYFLIRHFGGIYMDLDDGLQDSLDSLLYFPAWTTDSGRGALNINALGGTPDHPFYVNLTNNIIPYADNYLLPYVTVNLATGPWYFTRIWNRYHAEKPRHWRPLTSIRNPTDNDAVVTIFTPGRAHPWQSVDNAVVAWVGAHLLLTLIYFLVMVAVAGALFSAFILAAGCVRSAKANRGYQRIDHTKEREDPEVAEATTSPGVGP